MANKYIWCVEIYVFDVQLGYTNVTTSTMSIKFRDAYEKSKLLSLYKSFVSFKKREFKKHEAQNCKIVRNT